MNRCSYNPNFAAAYSTLSCLGTWKKDGAVSFCSMNSSTFQDTILSRRELTNLGIMKSPGTGSMILSMYCPIFQKQECIGYVGAGVFASRLMDSLLALDIEGLPNSEYVFLNVTRASISIMRMTRF